MEVRVHVKGPLTPRSLTRSTVCVLLQGLAKNQRIIQLDNYDIKPN